MTYGKIFVPARQWKRKPQKKKSVSQQIAERKKPKQTYRRVIAK